MRAYAMLGSASTRSRKPKLKIMLKEQASESIHLELAWVPPSLLTFNATNEKRRATFRGLVGV
jgi:hypothetical protein